MNSKSRELKEQEWDKYDFDRAITKFTIDEPFYSYISCRLHKSKSDKIPTAAVNVAKDGKMYLWYNEEFFNSLPWRHKHGVLIHEILHLVFNHTTSRKKENVKMWYIACDYAINSLIDENMLPDFCLMPGRYPDIQPEWKEKMSKEEWDHLNAFADMVRSWPKGMTSDWYYEQMKQNSEAFESFEKNNPYPGQVDDHTMWEELDEETREMILNQIRGTVAKAVEKSRLNNAWGSASIKLREELSKICSNQIVWQSILRMFLSRAVSVSKTSTIKKINKRFPYIHPGKKREYLAKVAICIDQSGSMSNEVLDRLFSELEGLSNLIDFVVVPFDSLVDEEGIFTWHRGTKPEVKRTLAGGTDFNPPTEWVNKHKGEFDAAIFLTDGYCSKPVQCQVPRLWIITPDGRLTFDTSEITIKMT